jgi:hypothetical protein
MYVCLRAARAEKSPAGKRKNSGPTAQTQGHGAELRTDLAEKLLHTPALAFVFTNFDDARFHAHKRPAVFGFPETTASVGLLQIDKVRAARVCVQTG